MAERPGAYRAPGALSYGAQILSDQKNQTMLGREEMLREDQAGVPCMGAAGRTSVLVHQRDRL